MTRSIFDPGGGETERSGSTFLGPDATGTSHVPPDVIDGDAKEIDSVETIGSGADDNETPVASDADEAAQRLREMTGDASASTEQ